MFIEDEIMLACQAIKNRHGLSTPELAGFMAEAIHTMLCELSEAGLARHIEALEREEAP